MNISLEAIKFNHDPTSITFDALNIRENDKHLIHIPEWRRGISANPEDSPAAYALFETRGNKLKIRAKFKHTNSTTQPVEIRALNQHVDSSSHNYFTQQVTKLIINPALRVFVGGPLGDVQSRWVTFNSAGETGYEIFVLQKPRLWEMGVGVYDITWHWQYRLGPNSPWVYFDTSRHRIYAILRQPQEPWQQSPFDISNLHLPWTEVLEYACRWAATSQNPTDAATRITHRLYDLGRTGIARYVPDAVYAPQGLNVFLCAKFLFDLRRGCVKVNCADCATIVSTFTNILGGELWQSETTGFDYNPIMRIGESEWRSLHFDSHVLAWEEDCDFHNDVFDACLQVDGDEDPTASDPCHVPLLPTDIRFGKPGEKFYRYRLVAPNNPTGACQPQKQFRIRRPISAFIVQERYAINVRLLRKAARLFDFAAWSHGNPAGENNFFQRVILDEHSLDGWELLRGERLATTQGATFIESLWRSVDAEGEVTLLISIYEGASVRAARKWLLYFLASLHSFEGVRKEEYSLADVYFTLADNRGVVFGLDNLVVILRSAGKDAFVVDAAAEYLLRKMAVVPTWAETGWAHDMNQFKLAEMKYKVGVDIPLLVECPNPFDGLPLTYKFITDRGFIHSLDGDLYYRPLSAGQQEVRIFATNGKGGLFRQRLPLFIS